VLGRCGRNTGVLHCVQDDDSRGGLVVWDVSGTAFWGYVEVGFGDDVPAFLLYFSDHLGWSAADVDATAVVGCESDAFEESVGVAVGDALCGESLDHDGDSDLDGLAVFEGGQLEEWLVGDVMLEGGFVAEEVVGPEELAVEVAEG